MTSDEALPETIAPPLAPDATFDPDVASVHGVERLDAPALGRGA